MMKKRTIIFVLVSLCIGGLFYSCTNFDAFSDFDDLQFNAKSSLTFDAQLLKKQYQQEMPMLHNLVESGAINKMSEDEIKEQFSALSVHTVSMLKSYGFNEKDWAEFENVNDPRFVLAGMLFLSVMEENDVKAIAPVRTKSITTEGDDEGCLLASLERIYSCVTAASALSTILDGVKDGLKGVLCVTRKVLFSVLKKATAFLAIADAIILIVDVADCLGISFSDLW